MRFQKHRIGICLALAYVVALITPRYVAAAADLYVSGTFSYPETGVKGFQGSTGLPYGVDGTGNFATGGGLYFPRGLVFGPDGNLYVSSEGTDNVLKYNGSTGVFLSEFIAAGAGGLTVPKGLAFAGGKLYVAGSDSGSGITDVLRFDATTGVFVDKLSDYLPPLVSYEAPWDITPGPGGDIYFTANGNVIRFNPTTHALIEFVTGANVSSPPRGLTFGPDGNLYVSMYDRVRKFDGTTGALLSTFVTVGSGGLVGADGLEFGPDGFLYVSSTSQVLRYSGVDGHFVDVFAALDYPHPFGAGGLTFHNIPEPASLVFASGAILLVRRRRPAWR